MENYIETLEQVIILLEDNKYITCHGDNIECNQILIDKLQDVYKFIKNNENFDEQHISSLMYGVDNEQ